MFFIYSLSHCGCLNVTDTLAVIRLRPVPHFPHGQQSDRITRAHVKISLLPHRLVSPRARRFSRMPAYFPRFTISEENERLLVVQKVKAVNNFLCLTIQLRLWSKSNLRPLAPVDLVPSCLLVLLAPVFQEHSLGLTSRLCIHIVTQRKDNLPFV